MESPFRYDRTIKEPYVLQGWEWKGAFLSVPNFQEAELDEARWVSNQGKMVDFSFKNVWMDKNGDGQKVEWESRVRYTQCVPKHAFFLWMAVQEKLFTHDKLLKWNPTTVFKCSLCEENNDSHEHLFFKCRYSVELWKRRMQEFLRTLKEL
ncbi:RNA-directed DNA polymerase, eukaryota, Reverse transcriptase zinc-binding domain protein [Artemisia annua]|uniref:RNA-directed DNA polymerase, eukaryota, Reverse transcriptase zinc-binding domain protein n=1 Tax=Artemisia annua TaxID=35608 RepID=A0A2U1M7T7_ARTAN|nr:RNA-directed DNA polymerase, eukaryota, Reverse transcriptase zinc-binding domain protein [Artemisia annua]